MTARLATALLCAAVITACQSNTVSVEKLNEYRQGDTYVIPVKGQTITLRKIEGDFFVMGPTLDLGITQNPELEGVILEGYAIGTAPVDRSLWAAVMGGEAGSGKVSGISWDQAQKFTQKLQKLTGIPFRLPSEAEWEYAARHNASMCGGLWEWCQDLWEDGSMRALRGGGKKATPATRQGMASYTKSPAVGLRLAVSTGEPAPAYWKELIQENRQPREVSNLEAETFQVNGVSFKMIPVEGGSFQMGATAQVNASSADEDEFPVHTVTLDNFKIGKYEVTCNLWQAVMGSLPPYLQGGDYPVCNVSWYDAQLFIVQLNRLTGRKFRLPTEAEWEYAAKGGPFGTDYSFAGSNTSTVVSWHEQKDSKTHKVGQLTGNVLGLYDMSGNAWEWVQDRPGAYSEEAQTNPTGPAEAREGLDIRVMRGGSANAKWQACRVSNRGENYAAKFKSTIGLRLAL